MILGIIAGVISSLPVVLVTFVFESSLNPLAGIAALIFPVTVSADASSTSRRRLLLAAGLVGITSFGVLVAGLSLLWFPARSCS